MKKELLILVVVIGFIISVNAQDIILKQDGSEIIAKVIEITEQQIMYKEFEFQSGSTRNINVSEVFMITYENGQKEIFSTQSGNHFKNMMAWEIIDKLKYDDYTIYSEGFADLKQGESESRKVYFAGGDKYIIICFSDDNNVLEVGIDLERMQDGTIDDTKATDKAKIAWVEFAPKVTKKMKVAVTNHSTHTPNYASRCRIIIFRK